MKADIGRNLKEARAILGRHSEIISSLKLGSVENEPEIPDFASKCTECDALLPVEHVTSFNGLCFDCAQRKVEGERIKVIKRAIYFAVIAIVLTIGYFVFLQPAALEKLTELREKKIIGNIFKPEFMYFLLLLSADVPIIGKYLVIHDDTGKPQLVKLTVVLMAVALTMVTLLIKDPWFMVYDIALAVALVVFCIIISIKHYFQYNKLCTYRRDNVAFKLKMAGDEQSANTPVVTINGGSVNKGSSGAFAERFKKKFLKSSHSSGADVISDGIASKSTSFTIPKIRQIRPETRTENADLIKPIVRAEIKVEERNADMPLEKFIMKPVVYSEGTVKLETKNEDIFEMFSIYDKNIETVVNNEDAVNVSDKNANENNKPEEVIQDTDNLNYYI